MGKKVSASVVNRLPRYYRYLTELESNGIDRISSRELSNKMGLTASQIRQDLNCFGGFGQQGYGYNVKHLYNEIAGILGLGLQYKAILVGAGNMGQALIQNTTFEKRGFSLIGIFDNDPKKIGNKIKDIQIMDFSDIESFIQEHRPTMAIISTPKVAANQVAGELIKLGIKAFLNFTSAEITMNDNIVVENIHLSDSLMRLCYKICEQDNILQQEEHTE